MRTFVYIDGFNFYYRLFKNKWRRNAPPRHHKWIDLHRLSCAIEPDADIAWIGYFTAHVKPTPHDPEQHNRQRAYLAALETIPTIEIVRGNFRSVTKTGIEKGKPGAQRVEFETHEEKGSDVNLASRLVLHAAQRAFEQAVVITNDGDLVEPIRIATQVFGLPVRVYSPDVTYNGALGKFATEIGILDTTLFRTCLFPDTVTTKSGVVVTRPERWSPR